ncbi:MAG: type ISP restriction/modification enzyme [Cytophagales bacterium]|nr:hypothetical protein [Bernardetiaceae bacterium]MDW8205498.1 type ISP restriction/modification enzyme [Cytophagales bacterium]
MEAVYQNYLNADKREQLLAFRDMLRNCLHPSFSGQATLKVLQTMQQCLQTSLQAEKLLQTPLFKDAAPLLAKPATTPTNNFYSGNRIELPFAIELHQALFVNILPCKHTPQNTCIVCTSVEDYIQIAEELDPNEQNVICLADTAASPIFVYQLSQPDLFRPLANNEQLARQVAANRYTAIVAALPCKKELPKAMYQEAFFVAWLQSLERLLQPDGMIGLAVHSKFFWKHQLSVLRHYLAVRFQNISIYALPPAQENYVIVLHQKRNAREFYLHTTATPEPLYITNNQLWLAASEQVFFEGIPLSKALSVPFTVALLPNGLQLSVSVEQLADAVTDEAQLYLKKHYRFEEAYEQKRAMLIEYAHILTDTDELQYCHVHPEMGQELRQWIQWTENKETKKWLQQISNPDFLLAKQAAKIARLFDEIKRKFEKMGQKAALDRESRATLEHWFEKKTEAIAFIQNFFDQPDFDMPLRSISKTDVFYYIFAQLQSETYYQQFRRLLHHTEPRIYPMENFWTWVAQGEALWKKQNASI